METFFKKSLASFVQSITVALELFALCLLFSTSASASLLVTPTDWSNETSGTIGEVNVALSSIATFDGLYTSFDASSSYFSAAPLPPGTEFIHYSENSNWTATFSAPMQGVLLYIGWWRGNQTSEVDPSSNYTFNRPFNILSGLQDVILSGTTLTFPDAGGSDLPGFHSGIIQFSDSITSISVIADIPDDQGHGQVLTFAAPIPIPPAIFLFGSGIAGVVAGARLKKKRQ